MTYITGKRSIQELPVKCTGCGWEGPFDTVQKHLATCDTKSTQPSTQCYVFVDNSNLWITGQKVKAKELVGVNIDPRFRVDHGKFLQFVIKGRKYKAYLYGSVPPESDSVWKALEKKNFEVKTLHRSDSGKEKEVTATMMQDMNDILYEHRDIQNVTFIIVTGNRDIRPTILKTLQKGVPVELWSWQDAMAREFCQLANTEPLFRANTLDSVKHLFSYTNYKSNHDKWGVDPAHAIVYRNVPDREEHMLTNHMDRLSQLFLITPVKTGSGRNDYIIEFPNLNPENIFTELRKLGDIGYPPCSYPEYRMPSEPEPETKEPLPETKATAPLVEATSENLADDDNFEDWSTKGGRKVSKTKKKDCSWGDHCKDAAKCPYQHIEQERELFARFPNIQFQFFRTAECKKKHLHITAQQKKKCAFAHDSEDSWCLTCRRYGHLTNDCKVNK